LNCFTSADVFQVKLGLHKVSKKEHLGLL